MDTKTRLCFFAFCAILSVMAAYAGVAILPKSIPVAILLLVLSGLHLAQGIYFLRRKD